MAFLFCLTVRVVMASSRLGDLTVLNGGPPSSGAAGGVRLSGHRTVEAATVLLGKTELQHAQRSLLAEENLGPQRVWV